MLGWGISIGGQIIIARRYGQGAHKTIGRLVEHLLVILAAFALVLTLAAGSLSDIIMGGLVESEEVLIAGKDYFDYRILGLGLAFMGYAFQSLFVGIAHTKIITVSTVTMVITNIILDYTLIFGHWGFPELGVGGAALASTISEGVGLATFLIFTLAKFNYKQFNLFRFRKFSPKIIVRILNLSWPLMFQFTISVFVWFVFFIFVEKMGETPLAVSNIVRSIYNVIILPIWGFASATNTLVSQQIGRGDDDGVMPLVYKILRLGLLSVGALAVTFFIFGRFAVLIYTNDPAMIEQVLNVMYVVEIAALGMAAAYVLFDAVSGTGRTKVSFGIETIALVFHLVWAYTTAIVLHLPLPVVWISEFIFGGLTALLSLWYLKTMRWKGVKM